MIRQATFEDVVPVLFKVVDMIKSSKLGEQDYDPRKIKDTIMLMIRSTGCLTLIAENSDIEIVGFIAATCVDSTYSYEKIAREFALWVDPENKNPKVILRLFEKYFQWAKDQGCRTIQCSSLNAPYSRKFRGLLHKLGFTKIEEMWMKEI